MMRRVLAAVELDDQAVAVAAFAGQLARVLNATPDLVHAGAGAGTLESSVGKWSHHRRSPGHSAEGGRNRRRGSGRDRRSQLEALRPTGRQGRREPPVDSASTSSGGARTYQPPASTQSRNRAAGGPRRQAPAAPLKIQLNWPRVLVSTLCSFTSSARNPCLRSQTNPSMRRRRGRASSSLVTARSTSLGAAATSQGCDRRGDLRASTSRQMPIWSRSGGPQDLAAGRAGVVRAVLETANLPVLLIPVRHITEPTKPSPLATVVLT